MQIITLAGGCFWCTEAIFKRLEGVVSVVPGYSGGEVPNPTYNDVCTGNTGHAEAVQIEFDESKISLKHILELFFELHDPTTLNQQGNDIGTQYRSAIFFRDENQRDIALNLKENIDKSGKYSKPIVTEVVVFKEFYPAESYHRDYYDKNENAPYCNIVIGPKITKLLKNHSEEIKPEYK